MAKASTKLVALVLGVGVRFARAGGTLVPSMLSSDAPSMPPTLPPALPPAPPPTDPGIITAGDPILKRSDGTEIQFFLEPAKFQRVFEQSPFNVSYLVGNPLDKHGGDWVLQVI